MGVNQVQAQPRLSMAGFIQWYSTEGPCEAALGRARWASDFRCPVCRCWQHERSQQAGRDHWQCRRFPHQTTVTAGTIFADTKVPLTRRILAMHLLTQARNHAPVLEFKPHPDVSYTTAWRIKRKLMQVGAQREESCMLVGRVEINDAALSGEHAETSGRGSSNKILFVMAVVTFNSSTLMLCWGKSKWN